MRILKIWLLAAIVAGAIIGLLAVTKAVTADQATEITLMTFGSIIILAASHFAWDMLRGRSNQRDKTDKPVP